MRKIFLAVVMYALPCMVMAQDEFDALRLNSSDIIGTARYVSMSGAFAALGGDVSAIKDNPAAVGVFRSSEISITMDFNTSVTNSNWGGVEGQAKNFKAPITQASYVLSFNNVDKTKGLVGSSVAFVYSRLKTYNRRVDVANNYTDASLTDFMAAYAGGKTADRFQYSTNYDPYKQEAWLTTIGYQGYLINPGNEDNTWLSHLNEGEQVKPTYRMYESGYLDEYSFTWGANVSNAFYFGASLNMRNLNYAISTTYTEGFSHDGEFIMKNKMNSYGYGFNLGVGFIARPTDYLRIAASVQTPTFYTLTDRNSVALSYNLYASVDSLKIAPAPDGYGYTDYKMQSPFKVNAGIALVAGKKGLLSAEYAFENYRNIRMADSDGSKNVYTVENTSIKSTLNNAHTFKLGAEYRVTNNWAVRAGGAYQLATTKNTAAKLMSNMLNNSLRTDMEYWLNNGTTYASAGFGYRDLGWYIDFAYQYKLLQEDFYAFDSSNLLYAVNAAMVKSTNHIATVTLGLKF